MIPPRVPPMAPPMPAARNNFCGGTWLPSLGLAPPAPPGFVPPGGGGGGGGGGFLCSFPFGMSPSPVSFAHWAPRFHTRKQHPPASPDRFADLPYWGACCKNDGRSHRALPGFANLGRGRHGRGLSRRARRCPI